MSVVARIPVVHLVAFTLAMALVGCARKHVSSAGPAIPQPPPHTSSLAGADRAQAKIDETIARLPRTPGKTGSVDTPPAASQLGTEPGRPASTSGTIPPPSVGSVVVTERPATESAARGRGEGVPGGDDADNREAAPLGWRSATAIAFGLIVAIITLPRVKESWRR